MTASSSDDPQIKSMRDSIEVFREPLVFDLPDRMEPPMQYHEVLQRMLDGKRHLLQGPRRVELETIGRDIVEECKTAEQDAMRAR